MIEYLNLLEDVLTHGKSRSDPQGVGNYSIFGRQVHYHLKDGFPLITTRDMTKQWRVLVGELLWILSGSTNTNDLHRNGIKLWDQWDTLETSGKLGFPKGELGPTYGHQLRNFNGRIDQLTQVINMLKLRPDTRRGIISYWNLEEVEIDGQEKIFIAPCIAMLHLSKQDDELNLHMFQRAADLAAGVPFDVAQYALLLMMAANELKLKPGTLVHTLSDAHIYKDQIPAVKQLLQRQPKPRPLVTIKDSLSGDLFNHQIEDFNLHNYDPHPPIKIPVAT